MSQFTELISNLQDGLEFAQRVGYPIHIRPRYTLSSDGVATARNEENLKKFLEHGLALSPVCQVLLDAKP